MCDVVAAAEGRDRRSIVARGAPWGTAMTVRSPDWLACHARGRPRVTAVVDLGTSRSFTYEAMNEGAERLVTALFRQFGVG